VGENGRHWELHRDPPMVSRVGPMTQSFCCARDLDGTGRCSDQVFAIANLDQVLFFLLFFPPFKSSPCQLLLFLTPILLPFYWEFHQLRNCIALNLLHKNHR
jgi:hypothetical protein